jgi:hypothetical protein
MRQITPTGGPGPWLGGTSGWLARLGSACGAESRGAWPASGCSVGTCASRCLLVRSAGPASGSGGVEWPAPAAPDVSTEPVIEPLRLSSTVLRHHAAPYRRVLAGPSAALDVRPAQLRNTDTRRERWRGAPSREGYGLTRRNGNRSRLESRSGARSPSRGRAIDRSRLDAARA